MEIRIPVWASYGIEREMIVRESDLPGFIDVVLDEVTISMTPLDLMIAGKAFIDHNYEKALMANKGRK
jgi:hypothetical protein